MDTDSVELASTAAATMVALLTTDAWSQVKKEIGALWRRFRPEQAGTVEAELTAAHEEAVAGGEPAGDALRAEWEARLRRLLTADAAVAVELGQVTTVLARMLEQALREPRERHENITISQRFRSGRRSAGSGRRRRRRSPARTDGSGCSR